MDRMDATQRRTRYSTGVWRYLSCIRRGSHLDEWFASCRQLRSELVQESRGAITNLEYRRVE